jgi:hypothetical protein
MCCGEGLEFMVKMASHPNEEHVNYIEIVNHLLGNARFLEVETQVRSRTSRQHSDALGMGRALMLATKWNGY